MKAYLTLPIFGGDKSAQAKADGSVTIEVRVMRAQLVTNNYNHADTLSLTVDAIDSALDPRLLSQAVVQFYLGNANEEGQWVPSAGDLRFKGVLVYADRTASADGVKIDMTFHDYTAFFLETRKYPASGMPRLDQDLTSAWQTICDNTGIPQSDGSVLSTVSALCQRIRYSERVGPPPVIGQACSKRLRGLGRVQVKPGCDAWAIWQQCVAMCGLITFIRLDEVWVVYPLDYSKTERTAPRLDWGRNILSLSERHDTSNVSSKGVGVTSFDPLTGTTLEAVYPPNGDPRVTIKKAQAAAGSPTKPAMPLNGEDREWIDYPAISDQDRLNDIALRIYAERSVQALTGMISTSDMDVDGNDLINLQSGDTVHVGFDRETRDLLSSLGSQTEQIATLMKRGYSDELATLMAKNMAHFGALDSMFFVSSVTTSLSTDADEGDFQIDIGYCNRISIEGSTGEAKS